MLDALGAEYIFQHIRQEYAKQEQEMAFRIYVTDALKAIAENTARAVCGILLKNRYFDIIDQQKPPSEDPRTEEEVVAYIRSLLKGGACVNESV